MKRLELVKNTSATSEWQRAGGPLNTVDQLIKVEDGRERLFIGKGVSQQRANEKEPVTINSLDISGERQTEDKGEGLKKGS